VAGYPSSPSCSCSFGCHALTRRSSRQAFSSPTTLAIGEYSCLFCLSFVCSFNGGIYVLGRGNACGQACCRPSIWGLCKVRTSACFNFTTITTTPPLVLGSLKSANFCLFQFHYDYNYPTPRFRVFEKCELLPVSTPPRLQLPHPSSPSTLSPCSIPFPPHPQYGAFLFH